MRCRFILLFLLLCVPAVSGAQFNPGSMGGSVLSISLNPPFPSPGETVTASIENITQSTNGSQISWTYGGAPLTDATNRKTVEITAGAAGETASLVATLNLPQGGTETVQTTIKPVYLDIIIEPQTRTPDWYLGRALPSIGSQVNATALLNDGGTIAPNNIVYTWRLGQNTLADGPIRAGSRVSFDTPRGADAVLRVTAADLRGNVIASRSVLVPSVLPELRFYEKHPLYGQQQFPVKSNLALIGNSITVQAEPYFLDTRVYNQPDIAEWEINQRQTDNGANNPYEISLTRSGVSGQTLLNFHVRSLREVLQGTEKQISVNF